MSRVPPRERSAGYSTPTPRQSGAVHTRGSLPDRKEQQLNDNQRRVQRQKLERKFMSEITQGGRYRLQDFHKLVGAEQERLQQRLTAPSPRRSEPRRKGPRPPTDPIRCVHEFGGSIRCLELTQGGATLWTGDNDGTISIRNGATGEIVHHIPASGGLYADALYSTETHMWVGMNDGTVRIYDHLVYILVSETQFHTDGVTCFASTFDGKIFSGSADANIIKWDTEANNFERMAKLVTSSDACVHCLTCYGYNLFIGGDDNVIRCLDTESGQELRRFDGHTDSVRALLVQDGYLFSGSMDCSVRVWNIEFGEELCRMGHDRDPAVGHTAAVTSLIGDDVAHRVWSADVHGVIHIWDSTHDQDFSWRYELNHGEGGEAGPPVIALKSFCTIDAIKLWSLAANGRNMIWSSSVNRIEDAVRTTIDAMGSIINQDEVELRKWKELIHKLEDIDDRRKQSLAYALASTTDRSMLRYWFDRWLRWLPVQKQRTKRSMICSLLMRTTDCGLMRLCYDKFHTLVTRGKDLRRRRAAAAGFSKVNRRTMQLVYWRKMKAYASIKKRQILDRLVSESLMGSTDTGLRRVVWRRFLRWHRFIARKKKRMAACRNILRCTSRGLLALYWWRLKEWRQHARKRARRDRFGEVLLATTDRGLRRLYYRKWHLAVRDKVRRKRRIFLSDVLSTRHVLFLRARYYGRLEMLRKVARKRRVDEQIAAAEREHASLQQQFTAKEEVLARYKEIEDKKREVEEAESRRAQVEADVSDLSAEIEELKRKLEERKQGQQKKIQESKQKMVEDLMSVLKAKVMNYHRDLEQITKIRDQVQPRGSVPVQKVFLEAHIMVKRIVVDITKCSQETGQRWRGMDKHLTKVPDHHKAEILKAIKSMIIAYDLMPEATKESLETDDEIIKNTDYLKDLAEQGKVLDEKRRGIRRR